MTHTRMLGVKFRGYDFLAPVLQHICMGNSATAMDIPRLKARSVPESLLEKAVAQSFAKLGYFAPSRDQKEAIVEFVKGKN